MQVTKIKLEDDSVEVHYTERRQLGEEQSVYRGADPGHPDLRKAWQEAERRILALAKLRAGEDKELRSIRFKSGEEFLEADFTVLQSLPYTTRPLVLNLPPARSGEEEAGGMSEDLFKVLVMIQTEARHYVAGEKREQVTLELEDNSGEEEEADG